MKTEILFLLFVILFTSCSHEEETSLQAYNAEAFAFQLDGGWEVNASIRVKGFRQNKSDETFRSKISYTIGIITPLKDTVRNLYTDRLNEEQSEAFTDLPVEVQIELDSAYSPGKYQIIFDIKDELSGKNTSAVKEVVLD